MSTPLKIIADAHIWGVESAFSTLPGFDVDLTVLESSRIKPATVRQADILLTRSSTRVHAGLLGDSSVRFAGTATIGDDHYDKAWLDQAGIAWANAAGSSTGSVVEYMVAALLHLHEQRRISIPNSCIGIIGAGRIGSEIETICRAIGMQVVVNDPPRARKEGGEHFCSLDELLRQTDLITLHTPLIREGTDCTRHLLNGARLRQFGGRGVINAARGACVDNDACCSGSMTSRTDLQQWIAGSMSHVPNDNCSHMQAWLSPHLISLAIRLTAKRPTPGLFTEPCAPSCISSRHGTCAITCRRRHHPK